MKVDMSRFLETFLEEAGDHIEAMEVALLALENDPSNEELLNTVFRAAHTIKGSSSVMEEQNVGRFAHVLENLLDRMREGEIAATAQIVELLLVSVDVLRGLIAAKRDGTAPPTEIDSVIQRLKAVCEQAPGSDASESNRQPDTAADEPESRGAAPDESVSAPSETCPLESSAVAEKDSLRDYSVRFQPSREFFHFGLDPLMLVQELISWADNAVVQLDTSQLPPLAELDPETSYLAWDIQLQSKLRTEELRDVFLFVDDATVVDIRERTTNPHTTAASISSAAFDQDNGPFFGEHDLDGQSPEGADSPAATETTGGLAASATTSHGDARPTESPNLGQLASETETTSSSTTHQSAPPTQPAPPTQSSTATRPQLGHESVRVDAQRLDDLINQIGELVIGASIVEQEWNSLQPGVASSSLAQLGKIVRDLQEMSLSLRMVPIAATFRKMSRIVRDLGHKLGKQINFETIGDDTELDKTVVDQIGDPLLHMVRNAADHGIETPEERLAAGKPAEGRVVLRAFHQGGNIYLEISDDGRGLNRPAIVERAIERGLISKDDTLTDEEICNLVFAPGFSTAQAVTDVSGRGVGMDVVRRNVEALQGSVNIRSEFGKGSTITVRLPLTLAILDGLLVRLGSEIYIVPLLSVVESIRPLPTELKRVVHQGEAVHIRGEVVPLVRLHQLLHLNGCVEHPCEGLVVVVEEQGRKLALLVDELIGQQQVVIKNLEANFRKVPGLAGATILGDGRVSFILDVNAIGGLRT